MILRIIRVDQFRLFKIALPQVPETERGCVPVDIPTLKSVEVEWRFLERKRLSLTPSDKSVYIALSAGPKQLRPINAPQVSAGKRLNNHDEHLMLIIPVVGRYNMHEYFDRWPVKNGRGLLLIWPCSTAQRKVFLSYWASKPSPEQHVKEFF
jgi:hypothetical protein